VSGVTGVVGALAAEPMVEWEWVGNHTDDIWAAFTEHLTLTGIAVGVGFALALAMALVSIRWRWSYGLLAGLCSSTPSPAWRCSACWCPPSASAC
jgi:ABC-type proline/glycine betaine transport system permease subunit